MDRANTTLPKARLVSWSIVGPALLAACWSFASYLEWASNRDRLVSLLQVAGIEDRPVIERLRREPTLHHAQLDAARALVFALLQAPALEALPENERAEALVSRRGRLRSAHELAREALAAQPNSWEAAMLQGATTYLIWSLERDRRLFTAPESWQEPLINAWREAPGRAEPRRILGTAYLELWPALSPARKRFATDLLAVTFADDPDAFKRLGPVWLDTVGNADLGNADQALEIIPDTPSAWAQTERYFAERRRWARYREAHLRGQDSLERKLSAGLADGERRVSLGDDFNSRTRFARVIGDAPPDQRFIPLVDRALSLYPAGLQTAGTGNSMERWLRFAIDLAGLGLPSLAASSVDRLGGVVQGLTPPDAALAALTGGDANLAERLERLDRAHSSILWTPYLIAKARWLLEHGDTEQAAATLDRIGSMFSFEAVYWQARRAVALARDDRPERLEAELWLDRIAAEAWPANDWTLPTAGSGKGGHRLVLLASRDSGGLRIAIKDQPSAGAVVQLRLDGGSLLVSPLTPRIKSLDIAVPVRRGLHLLEWSTLAGGDTTPGSVELSAASPKSS